MLRYAPCITRSLKHPASAGAIELFALCLLKGLRKMPEGPVPKHIKFENNEDYFPDSALSHALCGL
jgi:hypothetical protein